MQSGILRQPHTAAANEGEGDIYGRLSRLPALQPSALHLLSISLEGDSAASQFEQAFKADPALTADLLLVANSPLFGLQSRVHTIGHAISLLGLERVRSLAMAIAMKGYWQTSGAREAIAIASRHAIATAIIAESLGGAGHSQEALLYTGGLMHDIGRLALIRICPVKYQQVLSTDFGNMRDCLHLEHLLFQCAHDDAGAFLATAWDFPADLCDCIRFHHCELATHSGRLFEVVGAACQLADLLGYPEVRRNDTGGEISAVLDLLPPRLRQAPGLLADTLRAKVDAQLRLFRSVGISGSD